MYRLSLNSIPQSVFEVASADVADGTNERAELIGVGRILMAESARGLNSGLNVKLNGEGTGMIDRITYKKMNEKFQASHMMYAAKRYCAMTGEGCPENFAEFKRQSMRFLSNAMFLRVLQGIYTEIITPVLPRVYSDAVGVFADVVEVGFGETAQITVGSNDIPIFQDSAWGAHRSTPRNRFYDKDITLNPQPKTAQIFAKWTQLVGNGVDFGRFLSNITAGLYAKTMGMWNEMMVAAANGNAYIPSELSVTYSTSNFVAVANKLAAVNATSISNLIVYGSPVPLSKMLPTQVTGAANVNMDAAIATLLGVDYIRTGYIGENMGVRMMALTDAVIPGTQNTTIDTILPDDTAWMLSASGRKPVVIAYNSATPITLEIEPSKSGDAEIGINMTIALDTAAVFSDKVAKITIS